LVKLVDSRVGYQMWGAAAVQSPAIVAAHPALVPWVAISLWLALLGAAGGVLAVSGTVAWRQHRSAATAPSVWARRARRLNAVDLARLFAEVDSLVQHANAAAVAASRAELVLGQALARRRDVQCARDLAWREYDAAQRAYTNALRNPALYEDSWPMTSTSGAWPVLVAGGSEQAVPPADEGWTAEAVTEVAAGVAAAEAAAGTVSGTALAVAAPPERGAEPVPMHDLSRAALTAYRRGDLSVEQLREVFRRFSGWDSRHERHERAMLRWRVAEREAHRRYDMAAVAERIANHEVDVSAAAARAWADEAAEAAEDARIAQVFVSECLRHATIRRRLRRLNYSI
jgi:hypothetical protein